MENNQISVIEEQTTTLAQKVQDFKVENQRDYEGLANILKDVKGLQKRIKECFDPVVDAAYKAHKIATSKRKEHLEPAIRAERLIKDKLIAYSTEQNRIASEQQAKLDRQAKAEEERKKKAFEERAKKAEAEGKTEKAEELREKKEDVAVVAPIVAPRVETPSGISYRENWYAEVVDKTKIPMEYLEPNMPMLNKMAKAMKDQVAIPGVVFKFKNIMGSKSA